jgi:ribosomal protein S18 acetylase RimI-like enzyme
MQKKDVAQVFALSDAYLPEQDIDPSLWKNCFVFVTEDKVVGFIHVLRFTDEYMLERIAVDEKHRRKHIATDLLKYAMKKLPGKWLACPVSREGQAFLANVLNRPVDIMRDVFFE